VKERLARVGACWNSSCTAMEKRDHGGENDADDTDDDDPNIFTAID
jgi:hypothetical protein